MFIDASVIRGVSDPNKTNFPTEDWNYTRLRSSLSPIHKNTATNKQKIQAQVSLDRRKKVAEFLLIPFLPISLFIIFAATHSMISVLSMNPFDGLESQKKPRIGSSFHTHSVEDWNSTAESSRSSSPSLSRAAYMPGSAINEQDIKPRDVLCGRERQIHSHPGNLHFRQFILSYREKYQTTKNRDVKTAITAEVINLVQRSGGRFLKLDDGIWREIDRASTHEKVSHALRSAKDPTKRKPKRTRQVDVKPPSAEEEYFFQILAADQERIYNSLRENRVDRRSFF
jgi:hypothetical protein